VLNHETHETHERSPERELSNSQRVDNPTHTRKIPGLVRQWVDSADFVWFVYFVVKIPHSELAIPHFEASHSALRTSMRLHHMTNRQIPEVTHESLNSCWSQN